MKRKILMILIIVFLATGCSVDYNLEVDGTKFTEDFNINTEVNSLSTKEDLYNSYLEEYPIYNDDYEEFRYDDPYTKIKDYTYYTKSYQELENGYIFKYNASFNNHNDYNKARTLKMIFNTGGVGYIKDKDNYYISLSNHKLDYLGIDKLTIKITFKNVEIINNNASSVNGNTYTWIIDKNSNSTINVNYKLKNNSSTTNPENPSTKPDNPNPGDKKEDEEKENSIFDYILVGAVILLFFIGVVGLIKYKSINSNE